MNISQLYHIYKKWPTISTDSRKNVKDSIFFAIKGDNFDGNHFVNQAIENGAAYVVADHPDLAENEQIIKVKDSLITLQQLAEYHRDQLDIPIIAITGSNGKTTTKELVQTVLASKYHVFSTQGNLNNHIGVPLSILMIKPEHQIAVLELGANHIGENQFLLNISKPNFGILTNIGKDHLGEFGGESGVIAAYLEVIDYFNLNPNFQFIHNVDDPIINQYLKRDNCIKISSGNDSDFRGKLIAFFPTIKVEITKAKTSNTTEINTQLFGSFNLYNVLTAFAIGTALKIDIQSIKSAIEQYHPVNNRSQVINWQSNTIIFDAYNANPSSMELAIQDFSKVNHENKHLVLGSMHELGEFAFQEHNNLIQLIKTLKLQNVYLIGAEFGKLNNISEFRWFSDVSTFKVFLIKNPFVNSLVLVKGSRSEKLETAFTEAYYQRPII